VISAALSTYPADAKLGPVGLNDGLAILRLIAACLKQLGVRHFGKSRIFEVKTDEKRRLL
jgi:hypothetical protein